MSTGASGRDWGVRATGAGLAERYRDRGWWAEQSLGEFLEPRLRALAESDVRVWSRTRPYAGTVADVHAAARRFAGALTARGVGPGDVVAFQLPNCAEAAVVFWGAALAGAVLVPIVHFYGPKEVDYIVSVTEPAVFITPDEVFGADPLSIDGWLGGEELPGPRAVDPDSPALIAFTSGTTADPKGVIHTHRSIVAEVRQLSDIQPVGETRPTLTGAPVGHAIGMLTGLLLPVHRHQAVHLIDLWDPAAVLDAMIEGDLHAGSGATFFLTSLFDAPGFGPQHVDHMRFVGLGGAAVPVAVVDRANALGISVSRAYGSTEHPSTTGASHDLPQEKRKATDGRPLTGVELRIVDELERDVPAGIAGEIWSRGPDLCAGYTDPHLTSAAFTDDGWYRTGDIGVLDGDGWLTITDRKKDIIIRGGENISAAEVEDLLLRMPGVGEAAVVAAPDERLGEHACAFVRLVDPAGVAPTLEDVRAHLAAAGLAKQKWPEELRLVADLPRTPTGKVRKVELRHELRGEGQVP